MKKLIGILSVFTLSSCIQVYVGSSHTQIVTPKYIKGDNNSQTGSDLKGNDMKLDQKSKVKATP